MPTQKYPMRTIFHLLVLGLVLGPQGFTGVSGVDTAIKLILIESTQKKGGGGSG